VCVCLQLAELCVCGSVRVCERLGECAVEVRECVCELRVCGCVCGVPLCECVVHVSRQGHHTVCVRGVECVQLCVDRRC
jgi:hypothetical protein